MTFLVLIIITLLPLKGLIGSGITDAHDSISHVVRVASFYQSLTEGNLIPRWSQTLNYGYGHPIFMFLYPLPSYFASLFHSFGFSVIDSVKLVMAVSFILAGLFAYFWFKELLGKTWPALIGAAVFQLAPYRFINLYVRNAFGENTATLFIPLVFWRFTRLIRHPSRLNLIWASLSLIGLFLSHNAISLMTLPLLGVYAFTLLCFYAKKLFTMGHVIFAMTLSLGLTAFFWFPALIEGKYTLREIVMRGDTFAANFPYFYQLVIPTWGYSVSAPGPNDGMSFQVGIIQWLVVLLTISLFIKRIFLAKQGISLTERLALFFLLVFAFSIFIMLEISLPVWQKLTIIKKFQFPWRWLILSVTASGALAALLAHRLKFSSKLGFLLTGMLVTQTFWYWQPKGFLPQTETELINSYIGTTDTGESTPLWAVRFQEKPAFWGLSVVSGAPIDYQIFRRESELHEYTVTTTVDSQISDNTLYFPGWTVYVDGKKTPITYADPNWRGEITFKVPTGTHHIRVVFENTKLRRFANTVSLISLATLALVLKFKQ